MTEEYLIVVGDRFQAFSRLDNVVTKSQLGQALANRGSRPIALVAGQGVSHSSLQAIIDLTERAGAAYWVSPFRGAVEPAEENLCHKVVDANRLVSTPVRGGADLYRLNLVVDDENELLQDHVTGEHIPGMVLVEAARQSFLAVTEKYHAEPGQRYRFVTNQLHTQYNRFLFPLDVLIQYHVVMLDINRHGRIECTASIRFFQGVDPDPAAECEVRFKAYQANYVEERECSLAHQAIEEHIARVRHDDEVIRMVYGV